MHKIKSVESTLIILTRNEINGLKATIQKIPFQAFDEYFAVDYKSTDGSVEFFHKHHIPVVKQEKPGRAEAFYLGVRRAQGKYIIFFSPDGNENPHDLPLLVTHLKLSNDLVIASRFMKGARNEEDDQVLKFRAWANKVFTTMVNLLWSGTITDSINGYRGIKKNKFQKLALDAQGFAVEFQMTIRALKLGYKIYEIPTIEGNRIGGKSGSAAIPTGLQFIGYLVREVLIGKRFATQ